MRQEWGVKDEGAWPSRRPVWTPLALLVALGVFAAAVRWHYVNNWTPLQKEYFGSYVRGGVTPLPLLPYKLLFRHEGKARRLATEADVAAIEAGLSTAKLVWSVERHQSVQVRAWMREAIYEGQSPWAKLAAPGPWVGGLFFVSLVWTVPRDHERRRRYREGRRLRGPELVTTRVFNQRNRSDGIGFLNEERPLLDRLLKRKGSRMVCIPREDEAMHFLIMGDSGTGKSALIRQLLLQVAMRGEMAIVYDPASEYTPRFFNRQRGDVILNPLDARMPYWSPADEVRHEAEASTLAASLFPETHSENRFFVESPRRVFAHLLTFHPSPQQLVHWLSHEEEIDKRVKGTELAAMVYPQAAHQRGGVLASLNMVADSLKLLPKKEEAAGVWSATEWAKGRRGWIFLTTQPEYRERLRPLVSLWLDLLVLRLMNETSRDPGVRRTWFVLDELASLQKLPQLHTAVTENRKSGNPVVLGFQGRSQLEAWYGREAEAMFSQPATKVFLKTSEPKSAQWISDTIGQVERERPRESRSSGGFGRTTQGEQLERRMEPLVMASQISGLKKLHGYLKHGNLVVPLRFPYLELPSVEEAFIPRETTATAAAASSDDRPESAAVFFD